jgi:Uma2 family endonuclease
MSATTEKLVTAEELLELPRGKFRYELIKGELRQMSPAGYHHGKIVMRLSSALFQHADDNDLGDVCTAETGFLLTTNPDTVRAPDIAFVSKERADEVGNTKSYGHGVPDLAVEVTSPSDTVSRVEEKVQEWLEAGTSLVWVVSPKLRTVTIYRSLTDIVTLTEKDMLDGGEVVPGFRFPIARLFASKRK